MVRIAVRDKKRDVRGLGKRAARGRKETQSMISEVALALFTPPLLFPLFLSCCSIAMATKKCGNTSVLQRDVKRRWR